MRGGPNDNALKPTTIEIKREMSKPINPDAPSFPTTFPAEIRNAVYQVLFKREGPIEVMDPEEYRAAPAWYDDRDDNSDWGEEEESEMIASTEEYEKRNLYDFGPGIALLRVSRQIYHEAVGILYAGNSFCVTVPDHRHNRDMDQIATAARFCQAIESNLAHMSTLDIDIGRSCPLSCRDTTVFDILPLVNVLWSRSTTADLVRFKSDGRVLQERPHDDAEYESDIQPTVSQMNGIFHAFCQADSLAIRRYGRYERLIRTIWIDGDVEGERYAPMNKIIYRAGPRQGYSERITDFRIDIPNGEVSPCTTTRPMLKNLPTTFRDRILRYAMKSDNFVKIDLQRRSVAGLDVGLLGIDRATRNYVGGNIGQLNAITLRMETTRPCTNFDDYAALKEWFNSSLQRILPQLHYVSSLPATKAPGTTFMMHFKHSDTYLTGLRINILSFLRLTYSMASNTFVRISVGYPRAIEAHDIKLQTLRRRCFILLSSTMLQTPDLAQRSAPEIWIDGIGAPIQLRWPSSPIDPIGPGPGFPIAPEQIHVKGVSYIKEIGKRYNNTGRLGCSAQDSRLKNDTTELLWQVLRSLDWPEV